MVKISNEEINLPNGTYNALWTAYTIKIGTPDGDSLIIKTIDGVRGSNHKVVVEVKEKILYRVS